MRIDGSGSAALSAGQALAADPPRPAPAAPGPTAAAGATAGASLGAMTRDGTDRARLARTAEPATPPATGPIAPTDGYTVGPPKKPAISWDEDFKYNSKSANFGDHVSAAKWKAKLNGAELLRPDLYDATRAYRHYWGNTGKPLEVNYERAYRQDANVRANIDGEVARTAAAVDQMARSAGNGSFQVTGPARVSANYPSTENWQKTIGGYQQWSSANVTVNGNQVTMSVTVHAEDHYNFNRGQSDIASGASDNDNGRFTELGWARPFDTHGQVTRTITWTLGSPPSAADAAAVAPQR